jgi:signal transduction histidine kinase
MGWGALLEEMNIPKEMITELNKDVNRLQIITERFSKIGSSAELHQVDLRNTVSEALSYVQKRISPSISVTMNAPTDSLPVYINEALFGWVIENLVRNAADAMDKEKGSIHLTLFQEEARIIVDVQDNGKGIPKSNWKTVFKPGYTTKMRGWGLGLTLVKRIVEEYHRGSIYVKHSENDKGTTFRIELKAGIHPGV